MMVMMMLIWNSRLTDWLLLNSYFFHTMQEYAVFFCSWCCWSLSIRPNYSMPPTGLNVEDPHWSTSPSPPTLEIGSGRPHPPPPHQGHPRWSPAWPVTPPGHPPRDGWMPPFLHRSTSHIFYLHCGLWIISIAFVALRMYSWWFVITIRVEKKHDSCSYVIHEIRRWGRINKYI